MSKKIIHSLFFVFYAIHAFTQNVTYINDSNKIVINISDSIDIRVATNVTKRPEFPGGKKEWNKFLTSKFDLAVPVINKAPSGIYYVSVRATINRNGKIENVGAESACGYGMEKELIRCLLLSPTWQPAEIVNSRKVSFPAKQILIVKIVGQKISIEIP